MTPTAHNTPSGTKLDKQKYANGRDARAEVVAELRAAATFCRQFPDEGNEPWLTDAIWQASPDEWLDDRARFIEAGGAFGTEMPT